MDPFLFRSTSQGTCTCSLLGLSKYSSISHAPPSIFWCISFTFILHQGGSRRIIDEGHSPIHRTFMRWLQRRLCLKKTRVIFILGNPPHFFFSVRVISRSVFRFTSSLPIWRSALMNRLHRIYNVRASANNEMKLSQSTLLLCFENKQPTICG